MQQVTTMDRGATAANGAMPAAGLPPRNPGLGVVLRLGRTASHVTVHVAGGRAPVRLTLYVDGDLRASVDVRHASGPDGARAALALRDLAPGRHAVTVRAIDAGGRWGGASVVVSVVAPEAIPGAGDAGVDAPASGSKRLARSATVLHTAEDPLR